MHLYFFYCIYVCEVEGVTAHAQSQTLEKYEGAKWKKPKSEFALKQTCSSLCFDEREEENAL